MDWISYGAAGLLLVSSTACGGPAPTAEKTAVESARPSASVTLAAPTSTTSSTPTASADAGAPLDPDTAPVVSLAGASAPRQQPAYASKALDVLATLPVKGRAPKTGYSRDQFGQAWADVDRNGCDTRNDTLRRDLTRSRSRPEPTTAWCSPAP